MSTVITILRDLNARNNGRILNRTKVPGVEESESVVGRVMECQGADPASGNKNHIDLNFGFYR